MLRGVCVLAACAGCTARGADLDSTSSGAVRIEAVARTEYLSADGARLFLMVRGDDRNAPVLLSLHGGPGGAERPLFRYYDGALEQRFVVAYWDQRGAGRSFDPNADPRELTIARHLADLEVVVERLHHEFGSRVTLIGHSWGAALALLYARAHPQHIAAVIAVAPLVDTIAQQEAQYAFVAAEAERRDDRNAQTRLRSIGPPPHRVSRKRARNGSARRSLWRGLLHAAKPDRRDVRRCRARARRAMGDSELHSREQRLARRDERRIAHPAPRTVGARARCTGVLLPGALRSSCGCGGRRAVPPVATRAGGTRGVVRALGAQRSVRRTAAFTAAVVEALASIGVGER